MEENIVVYENNGIVYLYLTQTDLLKNINFANKFYPILSMRNGVHGTENVIQLDVDNFTEIIFSFCNFSLKNIFLLFWAKYDYLL